MPYTARYTRTYPGAPVIPPVGAFDDVYPWIAQCLQDSVRRVANNYFDRNIRSALRDARPASVKALGTSGSAWFASLTGDDREAVAEAVALIVAADLQPILVTGGAGGDLTQEKTPEGASRSFASAESLRQSWRDRAADLLASCSFAPPESSADPSLVLFTANGPSRARCETRGRR